MRIKVALPKGRLLNKTADLLQRANWGLEGYNKEMPLYHLKSDLRQVSVKVFHEKDIPIQVAVGNYDLGICGLDWVEELLAKYPSVALVKVKGLGFGEGALYMAAGAAPSVPGPAKSSAGRPSGSMLMVPHTPLKSFRFLRAAATLSGSSVPACLMASARM